MDEARAGVVEVGGGTVAAFVRELMPGASWREVREWCRRGRVRVDGEVVVDSARRLVAGSRVEIGAAGGAARLGLLAADSIAYADGEVVVVRKPAGVMTVPFDEGDRDTLVSLVRTLLARRDPGRGRGPALRVVQRLDKETSGLLVFARTVAAERHLQQQLRHHAVHRVYLALANGAAPDATYETLLVPDRGDGLRGSWGVFRRAKGSPPETARRAVTRVAVRERLRGATLVACRLETGRQHQIRIHLAEAGFPLVGEKVYVRDHRGPLLGAPRPMLHAAELGFLHPRTGREMRFAEPPPADFVAALGSLRGRGDDPSVSG